MRERQRGRRVRVFKTGPDFLDPTILERASGNPVYQLDLWMGGEDHCRNLLYDAAGQADLILIEGAMGLFDGRPSSADLAALFGIPVLAVIDASGMAQTIGAIAFGLARFRTGVPVAGVFANQVGSERHAAMLTPYLPDDLPLLGWLARDTDVALPNRHLGLVHAGEIADLDARLQRAATSLHCADDATKRPIAFQPGSTPATRWPLLEGKRIAVAYDAAFSFLYHANIDTLCTLGAELHFFSPLTDTALPEADSLYLPGGYPELHLSTLADNQRMHEAIRAHHTSNKPIVAECGGMLYLLESLTDAAGNRAEMLGLLPGHAVMQKRLSALALQEIKLPGGGLRGHTFHYSRLETPLVPLARGECPNNGKTSEPVYCNGKLIASYVHAYFPSNPEAAARLFLQ
jgi:cobyrinic acid a,c-diamide synthase